MVSVAETLVTHPHLGIQPLYMEATIPTQPSLGSLWYSWWLSLFLLADVSKEFKLHFPMSLC